MKEKEKASFIRILWLWWPLVFCLIVIYGFSSFSGDQSNGLSRKIVQAIVRVMHMKSDWTSLQEYNLIFRKIMHFSEYLIMGMILARGISSYLRNNKRKILLSILGILIFASLDELYQRLIPGRSPLLFDVMVDTMGGMSGVLIYYYSRIRNIANQGSTT